MCTFYVLYDEQSRFFVRQGNGRCLTYTLNNAKHFTSEWSATNFRNKMSDPTPWVIKKVQHQ